MIQPADVLVENSIAFFIRNGFLIHICIYSNWTALIYEKDRDLYLTCTCSIRLDNICNM